MLDPGLRHDFGLAMSGSTFNLCLKLQVQGLETSILLAMLNPTC